jgi:hypothetical protein
LVNQLLVSRVEKRKDTQSNRAHNDECGYARPQNGIRDVKSSAFASWDFDFNCHSSSSGFLLKFQYAAALTISLRLMRQEMHGADQESNATNNGFTLFWLAGIVGHDTRLCQQKHAAP